MNSFQRGLTTMPFNQRTLYTSLRFTLSLERLGISTKILVELPCSIYLGLDPALQE